MRPTTDLRPYITRGPWWLYYIIKTEVVIVNSVQIFLFGAIRQTASKSTYSSDWTKSFIITPSFLELHPSVRALASLLVALLS